MRQSAIRWARRLLVLGGCALLLAAVVHSPWVRGLVLRQLTSRLGARTGYVYSADALDYNLFRLTASVKGFQISRRGAVAAPVLRVRHVEAALSPRALAGALEVDRLEAEGVALVIDLSPRSGTPAGASPGFKVPVFAVRRVVLKHASIEIVDPGRLGRLSVSDVSFEADGRGPRNLAGPFTVAGGVALRNDDARVRVDRVEGRAFLDGDAIGVHLASAMVGTQRLALDGSVVFTGPSPRFSLGIAGAIDVGRVASWFPALPAGNGPLQVTGRVTGPLSDPQFAYSVRSTGITFPDIRVPASAAEGRISRTGIRIDRMRTTIGEGWAEATGRLPFGPDDPNSRFSLKWANVSIASLAQVLPLLPADPIGMVASGSAQVHWPGMALEFATVEGSLTSEIRFAPALPAARVQATARPGRWAIRGEQALDAGTLAALDAGLVIDASAFAASAIEGTLRATSTDGVRALSDLRRGFPSLPDVSTQLAASPIALDASIGGTIGSPRLVGSAVSDRLRVDGLPPMHATAQFEATTSMLTVTKASGNDEAGNRIEGRAAFDIDAGTTSGAVTADIPDIEPIVRALLGAGRTGEPALKAGGSARISGEWRGAVENPVVAMTVGGTNLAVDTDSFGVNGASAEGRIEGPLHQPEGAVRLTAAGVRAAGLAPVPADAVIEVKAGRVEAVARVPEWAATIDGWLETAAPHTFAATLSIADLSAARLVALLGEHASDWTAGGAIAAKLDAEGDLDNRTLRMRGGADLAGGTIAAGERRFFDGMNASIEIRDGRLWLRRMSGLGFDGPLTASGDLPLKWVEDYLPEGWRVEEVSAVPTPAAFEVRAEPDVKALGTWLRPDEPGRIAGSLRMRASGTASTPSLAAVDGRLVIEPDTVTVRDVPFTLPRAAEVRIKDGRAAVEAVTITAPGTTASVSGTMALAGNRAIDARVSASGALGFLSSVVPGRVAGEFTADLLASGAFAEPGLNGRLTLDGAAWVWPEQRIAFRDWSGHATVDTEAVTFEALNGHANGGDASVSGELRFKGGGRGVTLRVRDAFAEVVKGLRSQADADLTLASAGGSARLAGKVTVTSGAYREPITAMARLLASAQEGAAKADPGPSLLDTIALDVELTAAAPIVIENSAGRLDLVPSMKLQGTLAEPAVFGSLDMVDEGRLTLLGRTFRLSEGRVAFEGTSDPSVRLIGETRVGDYDVTLRTGGPVSRLEPTFTSDPPLSQRDLQSLLVTGRTADVAGTKAGDDEEFALGAASSDLLGFAGQMVGLDSVQLGRADFELGSSDVDPAMRLTVSKTITGRTRLVLSQDLDNNNLTWIVAFSPKRGYEVRVSQRDNLEEVLEFRQELSFGPGVSPPTAAGFRKRVKGLRVSAVGFSGDLMWPVSELESVLELRSGKEFDAGRWQEDRARLEAFYRNRGYATARIVPGRTITEDRGTERVQLSYRVDHGPRTVLQVNGIDLSDGEHRELLRVWSGSVLPEFLSDDISGYLRAMLAGRGYLRPSIRVTVTAPDPDAILAEVAVTPGGVTGTRKLVIEGARNVTEPELRKALGGNPALEDAWGEPAPLVEAVVALYAQRGYASARVVAEELAFEGDTAERRLRVIEGPRTVVDDVSLSGVEDARAAGARAALGLQPGGPLLPGMEADARRRLERFYLDRGFRSATVRSASKSEGGGRVALSFAVTEGPVSIVNAVHVAGLDATRPGVAGGAIALKPGQPAGQQRVEDTQKQLYGLGVFRRADVTFAPVPPAREAPTVPVDVTVSLEEARRFQLRYGVHLSNEYGPVIEDFTSAIGVAADVRDRNFLGRAFGLGASGRLEKNLQSLRGQFSLPALLDQRLQTSLYATLRSETDTSEESATFTDREKDVTFEQRLRLPHRMEVAWGYSYNVRDVTFSVVPRNESFLAGGALSSLNGTFILDARDKPFDASRGWFQSSNVQWGLEALGSDIDYVRVLLRQFYYKPAGPFVFASGVRWGWLHGLDDLHFDAPDLPPLTIIDQFFDAGGSQTVRGYAEDSLSALEPYGAPIGGTKLLLLNQEVRFPLFSKWLQGAAFIDAGNTFKPGTSIKLDQLAVGAGFGIRIMTPFAPLRLDVGYPINRRPDDKPYRFYFSIGQIF